MSSPHTPPTSPIGETGESAPRVRTRSSTQTFTTSPFVPSKVPLVPPYPPDQSMLWLALFSQAEHFQSVRRISKITGKIEGNGPAEVEDFRMEPHEMDISEAAKRERGLNPEPVSTKVQQLLASLPAGHDVDERRASGVLGRVKGDLGEAVEILLEELDLERSSTHSDQHVENLLSESDHQTTGYRDQPSPDATSPSESVISNPSSDTSTQSGSTHASGHSTPSTSTSESDKKASHGMMKEVSSVKNAPNARRSVPDSEGRSNSSLGGRKDIPRELRGLENFLKAGKKEALVTDERGRRIKS